MNPIRGKELEGVEEKVDPVGSDLGSIPLDRIMPFTIVILIGIDVIIDLPSLIVNVIAHVEGLGHIVMRFVDLRVVVGDSNH